MRRQVSIAMLAALLGSCAVGPNYQRPAPPAVQSYLPEPIAAGKRDADQSAGQHFAADLPVPQQWWQLFGSRELDDLIEAAFHKSPTIAAAQAALHEAQENFLAARGAFYPTVQAQYSFERARNATGTLSPTLSSGQSIFDLHTAQVSVTYALDVFGGARRQAESLLSLAQSQQYQLGATYLSLAANVVTTAVQEAGIRAQLQATRDIVGAEQEALRILQRQYELGSIAMTDVMAQEATLATTEATLPGLQKQLEQARHSLAVLTGVFPGEPGQPQFELTALTLPQELPLTVPAELVRHRPDVLAAEAQLHSASAQVGVAIANMLPQINLTASAGGAATQLGQLFAAGNTFWSGGATLTQTLFAGGTLLHRERAARAALDQAGAQYRTAVLTAFQNVADTLSALQLDASAVEAGSRAQKAAANSLVTVRRNVELGSVGYLALLNAQQTYQQALLSVAQAKANRFADTAALYQALGGTWEQRQEQRPEPTG